MTKDFREGDMATFTIKASVSVDVEIDIQADSKSAAVAALNDHLIMTASLVDVPEDKFTVSKDSIAVIEIDFVVEE